MNSSMDYSDFEYQQLELEAQTNPSEGNVDWLFTFEPLEGIGSLANNEVAELVYHQLQATVEWEPESGSGSSADDAEFRGFFGANFNSPDAIFQNSTSNVQVETTSSNSKDSVGEQRSDDRIFQQFTAHAGAPIGSSNGGKPITVYERMWRDIVGRGPVLDSSDNLNIVARTIPGEGAINFVGNLKIHLFYDVAETDDAGRAFSVPE
jgi:hypothetical protein